MSIQEETETMEEYGNNGIFGVDRIQMRAVDRKQEIYLEWPSALSEKVVWLATHRQLLNRVVSSHEQNYVNNFYTSAILVCMLIQWCCVR